MAKVSGSFLVLRHGESMANRERVYAGRRLNSPLTPEGYRQAKIAAEAIDDQRPLTGIYSSPLLRAALSAVTLADTIGFNRESITYDPRLEDYDIGEKTGLPKGSFDEESDWYKTTPGAETRESFVRRVAAFTQEELVGHVVTDERLLVVAHSGICRAFSLMSRGLAPEDLYTEQVPSFPNGQPIPVDLEAVTENLQSYLPASGHQAA